MLGILTAIYFLIIIFEVPALLKRHLYKELSVFMVFFAISLYVGLAFFFKLAAYRIV